MKTRCFFLVTLFISITKIYSQCTTPYDLANQSKQCLQHVFHNPKDYPNYVFLGAHRGTWRTVPENSIAAIEESLDLNIEIVEIDLMKTKDGKIFLTHDWHLDRLSNGKGVLKDSKGNFFKLWNEIKPLKLKHPITHELTEYQYPLLHDALITCRDYNQGRVIISIDKAEKFMDEVYLMAEELGMLDQITWKCKIQEFNTPSGIRNRFSHSLTNQQLDDLLTMFTPTIFSEYYKQNKTMVLSQIDSFINSGAPGFEMIYFEPNEAMISEPLTRGGNTYNNVIDYIKDKNVRVFQFPEWPETCKGNWSPPKFRFRDINPKTDWRGDWDWLIKSANPDTIISDRLELFITYLKLTGKRTLN